MPEISRYLPSCTVCFSFMITVNVPEHGFSSDSHTCNQAAETFLLSCNNYTSLILLSVLKENRAFNVACNHVTCNHAKLQVLMDL